MDLNHVGKLMRTLYLKIKGEKIPTSYCQEPVVQGGTTHDPSWGEEELMKMAPGAKALSGRVPEQDPGDPRS